MRFLIFDDDVVPAALVKADDEDAAISAYLRDCRPSGHDVHAVELGTVRVISSTPQVNDPVGPEGLPVLLASQVIAELQALVAAEGDLPVYYADGYDNALAIYCTSVEEDTGWQGAPDEPAIYLS